LLPYPQQVLPTLFTLRRKKLSGVTLICQKLKLVFFSAKTLPRSAQLSPLIIPISAAEEKKGSEEQSK